MTKWQMIDECREDNGCSECEEKNYFSGIQETLKTENSTLGICYTCCADVLTNDPENQEFNNENEAIKSLTERELLHHQKTKNEMAERLKKEPPEMKEN